MKSATFSKAFFIFLGLSFLYIPIIILIIFSFNESKLVSVWSGFSTQWYRELFNNHDILNAALTSFKVAGISATIATILGTLGGISLTRFHSFHGKTLLSTLITTPLVMPEVIIGLAMLLLFVGLETMIGWPQNRSILTISIAHITFTIAYVAIITQSRLISFDKSFEDASLDLGAKHTKTFFAITLPIISPAIITGWLLAFTLSLDDLVIASFVSGPGATTLPMKVYSSVRLGISPEINALGTLIMTSVAIIIILVGLLQRNDYK